VVQHHQAWTTWTKVISCWEICQHEILKYCKLCAYRNCSCMALQAVICTIRNPVVTCLELTPGHGPYSQASTWLSHPQLTVKTAMFKCPLIRQSMAVNTWFFVWWHKKFLVKAPGFLTIVILTQKAFTDPCLFTWNLFIILLCRTHSQSLYRPFSLSVYNTLLQLKHTFRQILKSENL
jgi:hypothetical protein